MNFAFNYVITIMMQRMVKKFKAIIMDVELLFVMFLYVYTDRLNQQNNKQYTAANYVRQSRKRRDHVLNACSKYVSVNTS